jgi:hypothetical protein
VKYTGPNPIDPDGKQKQPAELAGPSVITLVDCQHHTKSNQREDRGQIGQNETDSICDH